MSTLNNLRIKIAEWIMFVCMALLLMQFNPQFNTLHHLRDILNEFMADESALKVT